MVDNNFFIVGSGKHSNVVSHELSLLFGNSFFIKLIDKENEDILENKNSVMLFHGIGSNAIRKKVQEKFCEKIWLTVLSKEATIKSYNIGNGSQILSNASIMVNAVIGKGCIINTGAQVDHDCVVGNYSHIASNATLCGSVVIGSNTLIGPGTIIYPGVEIGDNCCVYSEKPIYKNIPNNTIMKIKL